MLTGNVAVECKRTSTGGKGNRGKYIERDKQICAAGIPTAQADLTVESTFHYYRLKDEVDALISDAIIPPPPKPTKLPPLRYPMPPDQRHCGVNSELADLVNPPTLTKFQSLVNDMKDTSYKSYWKSRLGKVPDPVPMFPEGFDIENTRFGKKTEYHGRLYDIVMPKEPLPDKTPKSKGPGAQTDRKYCRPAFNPDLTYGYRTNIDKRGIYMKCNLTDKRVVEGTGGRTYINYIQANVKELTQPMMGKSLAPNDNISRVPKGYAFGKLTRPENLPECLSTCTINPKLSVYRNCLKELNSLRKNLSTHILPTFFRKFYMNLKYYDTGNTGWLPKKTVYDYCALHLIRFDPSLIEPLLCLWGAFDGSNIEYKTFAHVLNFKEPLPELPKVPDIHPDCLDFRTTYGEMVKPGQKVDTSWRAGLPSGRYFDEDYPITPEEYCRAHRVCLPQESDMKSCLNPSIFTLLHVTHRDMYAVRDPATVKRVFEGAGEEFTDEKFNQVWEEAKKYHSKGWVSFETFRRALDLLYPSMKNDDN